ncbi:hypothetical protein [Williamsia maris]|uniref:Uncharacterized protein n=1 Tax=Williamsia maris TaxID=72806 RepID=A0ABT1HAT0_9NOCA|nr:hypothetical protein [Williamsia maris]MCP2174783.1 hypothetical protein [Williamsia maris]
MPRQYPPEFRAALTASATSVPMVALADHDEIGKTAARRSEDFGWKKKDRILSLSAWSDRFKRNHDVEIEDLLRTRPRWRFNCPVALIETT